MPNTKSQAKRTQQALNRRKRNQQVRSTVKTHMKRFRSAMEDGDRERAEHTYRVAAKWLDQAVSKGAVHRNYAANHKSRMARRLNQLQ
jgi:small subunit ribosomal protein S20